MKQFRTIPGFIRQGNQYIGHYMLNLHSIQFVLSTGLIILVHEFQGPATVILTGYFKESNRINREKNSNPCDFECRGINTKAEKSAGEVTRNTNEKFLLSKCFHMPFFLWERCIAFIFAMHFFYPGIQNIKQTTNTN
jgi:hypothetical protein